MKGQKTEENTSLALEDPWDGLPFRGWFDESQQGFYNVKSLGLESFYVEFQHTVYVLYLSINNLLGAIKINSNS